MEQSYNYIKKGNKVWCINPLLDKRKDPQASPYILGDITYIDTKKKIIRSINNRQKNTFCSNFTSNKSRRYKHK